MLSKQRGHRSDAALFAIHQAAWDVSTGSQMDLLEVSDKYGKELKAPYSSRVDIFFIQERFNKLIYGINTNKK